MPKMRQKEYEERFVFCLLRQNVWMRKTQQKTEETGGRHGKDYII